MHDTASHITNADDLELFFGGIMAGLGLTASNMPNYSLPEAWHQGREHGIQLDSALRKMHE